MSEEVLDVNALINLIEEDEDLLIGFVESYSVVENDSDVSTIVQTCSLRPSSHCFHHTGMVLIWK